MLFRRSVKTRLQALIHWMEVRASWRCDGNGSGVEMRLACCASCTDYLAARDHVRDVPTREMGGGGGGLAGRIVIHY